MSSGAAERQRLAGRRVLVTGAAGFLGRRVLPRLVKAGMRVTAQARGPLELAGVEARVSDMAAVEWAAQARAEWRWDDVVHLAGPVSGGKNVFVEEAQVARAHALIALALSRAIPDEWPGRVVHASSMTVYGAAPELPVTEAQPLAPRFPYALGKVLAEDVWRASPHRDHWLLRLPGLFCAERRTGALFHFIAAGLEGRPIQLTASEPTLWDILHVDDAAEAIVRALASPTPFSGAMNVSYGEIVELEAIARRISALTSHAPVVNEAGVTHPAFQLDISLARRHLGWPPCSLGDRLQALVHALRLASVSAPRGVQHG